MYLRESSQMRLHVRIIKAKDLPNMEPEIDSNVHCKLKIRRRKFVQNTKPVPCEPNPAWNEAFTFPVYSLGTDVLNIYVKGNNNRYFLKLRISTIPPGLSVKRWFRLKSDRRKHHCGQIQIELNLANDDSPEFVSNPFVPLQAHVRIVEADGVYKAGNLFEFSPFCSISMSEDLKTKKTRVIERTRTPQWDENFTFYVSNPNHDSIVICMKDSMNKKVLAGVEVGLSGATVVNKWFKMKSDVGLAARIHLMIHVAPKGVIPFSIKAKHESQSLTESSRMQLHVKVLKAIDLPRIEAFGKIDAYCYLNLNKTTKETKIIYNNVNPKWGETFHLDVLSYSSDIFHISIFNHHESHVDDLLGTVEFKISEFSQPGIVSKDWYPIVPAKGIKKAGKIKLEMHLGMPSQHAFVNKLFFPLQLHMRVIKLSDVDTYKDSYCEMRILYDAASQRTKPKKKSEWNEEFHFFLTTQDTDVFHMILKKNDTRIATLNILLSEIELYEVIDKWFDMITTDQTENGLKIHLQFQVAPFASTPFLPMKADQKQLAYKTKHGMQLHVNVIEAKDLSPFTVLSRSSTFVTLQMIGRDQISATHIVENMSEPKWNEAFHMNVISYGTDILHIILWDKNEPIATTDFNTRDISPGIVIQDWFSMATSKKLRGWKIRLTMHLAQEGSVAFTPAPFVPSKCHVRVIEASGLGDAENSRLFFTINMKNDNVKRKSTIKEDKNHWNENFHFYITNRLLDIVKISLFNADTDKKIGKLKIPLSQIPMNRYSNTWYELKPVGQLHVVVHLAPNGITPFEVNGKSILPYSLTGDDTQLLVHIYEVTDVIKTYDRMLCRMVIVGRNQSEETRYCDKNINQWDQEFHFNVLSLEHDVFKVVLIGYRKKEKVIGEIFIPLLSLKPGAYIKNWYDVLDAQEHRKGKVFIGLQLAAPNSPQFITSEWTPTQFHIKILDASFSNCTIKFFLKNDKKKYHCNTFGKTYSLLLTNPNKDILIMYLQQNNKNISLLEIPLRSFQMEQIVDNSFKFFPLRDATDGGHVHLLMQLNNIGSKPFEMKQVKDNFLHLKVKVIAAKNLPKYRYFSTLSSFCQVYINGRDQVFRTKVVKNSMAPQWNETFNFDVMSYGTDVLELEIINHLAAAKIGKFKCLISSLLKPGIVFTDWVALKPSGFIKLSLHVTDTEIGFINKPFIPLQLQVHVMKAITNVPMNESYCVMKLENDLVAQKTSYVRGGQTPRFIDNTFHFLLTNKKYDVFSLELRDKDISDSISKLMLPLDKYELNKIYDEWHELNNGRMNMKLQIVPLGSELFISETNDSQFMQLHVKVKHVDTQYTLSLLNRDNSLIKMSKTNQTYHMDILSFGTDVFSLTIFQNDIPYSVLNLPVKDMNPGIVVDDFYDLRTFDSKRTIGRIHLVTHLALSHAIPFKSQAFTPIMCHVRVIAAESLLISSGFIKAKINNDITEQQTQMSNQLKWNQDFHFLLTLPESDVLSMSLQSESADFYDSLEIPIQQIGVNKYVDDWFKLQNSSVHLIIHVANIGIEAFSIIEKSQITPKVLSTIKQMTFNMRIAAIKIKDENDLSYKMEMIDRNQDVLTNMINEDIHFPVLSFGTDVFRLGVSSKNKEIGHITLRMRMMPPGRMVEDWYELYSCNGKSKVGKVKLVTHLAHAGSEAFVSSLFIPLQLKVRLIDIAYIRTKDDSVLKTFCTVQLKDDLKGNQTSVKESDSPFWNQEFQFLLTTIKTDILQIRLLNQDSCALLATLLLPLKSLTEGDIIDETYSMKTTEILKNDVQVHLLLAIVPLGQYIKFPDSDKYRKSHGSKPKEDSVIIYDAEDTSSSLST